MLSLTHNIQQQGKEKNINGLLVLCTLCVKLFGVPGNEVALRPGGLAAGKRKEQYDQGKQRHNRHCTPKGDR